MLNDTTCACATRDATNLISPNRRRVLVVEDNVSVRLLLSHVLKNTYDVEIATGVEEALTKAAAQVFDALILDINLGEGRTGVDLLRALRQQAAYRSVPALACTAYALPADREHLLEAGFDEYASKPFTKERILEALARMFSQEEARTMRPGEQNHEAPLAHDSVSPALRPPMSRAGDGPAMHGAPQGAPQGGMIRRRFA